MVDSDVVDPEASEVEAEELFCPFCRVSMNGRDPVSHATIHGPDFIIDISANANAIENRRLLIEHGGVVAEDLRS